MVKTCKICKKELTEENKKRWVSYDDIYLCNHHPGVMNWYREQIEKSLRRGKNKK